MNKNWALILAIILWISAPYKKVEAGIITYNLNEFFPFKERTDIEVRAEFANALSVAGSYDDNDSFSWYNTQASIKFPYAAGVLTQDTHNVMTSMSNFYRWLSGTQELGRFSQHSESLQAQALDRNFEFAHKISNTSKPNDMPIEIWEAGFELDHNILAWATNLTPIKALSNWLNEGYNGSWNSLGHRIALLSGLNNVLDFGYSGRVAIGKIMERGNSFYTVASAFPSPGAMPSGLISPQRSAWHIELNADFLDIQNAMQVAVTINDLSNGKSYNRSQSNDTLKVVPTGYNKYIYFVQPKMAGSYSGSYNIIVKGLKEVTTKQDAEITYTVEFFDFDNQFESNANHQSKISAGCNSNNISVKAIFLLFVLCLLKKNLDLKLKSNTKH